MNQPIEHDGQWGYWAQGDCVFTPATSQSQAAGFYRAGMGLSEIAVNTADCDALRVKALAQENAALREALVLKLPRPTEGILVLRLPAFHTDEQRERNQQTVNAVGAALQHAKYVGSAVILAEGTTLDDMTATEMWDAGWVSIARAELCGMNPTSARLLNAQGGIPLLGPHGKAL